MIVSLDKIENEDIKNKFKNSFYNFNIPYNKFCEFMYDVMGTLI